MTPTGNLQTGGVVYELMMLEELIDLRYTGANDNYLQARDAAQAYLRAELLPRWYEENDAEGQNYWDWERPVQGPTMTDWIANYLVNHRSEFLNGRNDVRNMLGLFLNHTSAELGVQG